MRRTFFSAFLCLLMAVPTWGQGVGQLSGTVKDKTDAVVPGAKVVVAKVLGTATTDNSGSFQLKNLEPGEHLVLVESLGFELWTNYGVRIDGGRTNQVAVELSVAPPQERVISQEGLEARAVERYSGVLRTMKEPGLCEIPSVEGAETYRFLWLRTEHEPVLVRIDMQPDSTARVTLKINTGKAGWETGKLKTTRTRKLSPQDTKSLNSLLQESDFWQLPSVVNPGLIVVDGASWTMEGTKDGKCHVVDRDSPQPDADAMGWLALRFMLDFAKMKLLYQEVY